MEYPGSSLRVGALLGQAEIYQNDLHDAAAAKERYSLLVKEYPRSAQAEEAKAGIASLKAGGKEDGVGSRGRGVGAKASDLTAASDSSSIASASTASASAGAGSVGSGAARVKPRVDDSGASSV